MRSTPTLAKLVLVVDDNEDSARICEAILRFRGYTVLLAADGETGLELIRTHAPALVLLDIVLPILSGFEVAVAAARDPATAEIPIIAVTAHVVANDAERAVVAAAMAGYLMKPIAPLALVDAVEAVIGGAA